MRAARALPNDRAHFTSESLIADGSVPDPDFWVRSRDAVAVRRVGARLSVWRPEDVLLVVEVGDETVVEDLGSKARLYSRVGYERYWVLKREGVYEHTMPTDLGYRVRNLHPRGDVLAVPWSTTDVAVDALLASP